MVSQSRAARLDSLCCSEGCSRKRPRSSASFIKKSLGRSSIGRSLRLVTKKHRGSRRKATSHSLDFGWGSRGLMSGLCRTDRPYIPRLKPAGEAHPPVCLCCAAPRAEGALDARLQNLPGKDLESLSGGSKGAKPPWGLRSSPDKAEPSPEQF